MSQNATKPKEPRAPSGKRFMARLKAVQALYQMRIMQMDVALVIEDFLENQKADHEKFDKEHFKSILKGAAEDKDLIESTICSYLDPSWPIERIDSTLKALLQAAVYELLRRKDVPFKVVINEYINVARAFFGQSDILRVVNGLLDKFAKDMAEKERALPESAESVDSTDSALT